MHGGRISRSKDGVHGLRVGECTSTDNINHVILRATLVPNIEALPGFVWVPISVRGSTIGGRHPAKRGVFAASVQVEVQSSAMKEDGRLQMVPIAEAIGVFLIV